MAAGYKSATVNASDVPSTQSNFPAYIDLSRLGITTLAEAESVRVYSDESQTTELAREIVSAEEMWVKIPSLTSTFEIFVEWDGTRSDYATSATYGAEAVWSDYDYVSHDGGSNDSTANGYTTTANGGVTSGDSTGKIGDSTAYDGNGDYFTIDSLEYDSASTLTWQAWVKPTYATPASNNESIFATKDSGPNGFVSQLRTSGVVSVFYYEEPSGSTVGNTEGGSFSDGTWALFHITLDTGGAGLKHYVNASNVASDATATSDINNGREVWIGATYALTPARDWTGEMDEIHLRSSALSADWITTEHNNQSNESTFWGTWSDATPPVGGVTAPQFKGFAGL